MDASPVTTKPAPAPKTEQGRVLSFTVLMPDALRYNPDACRRYWRAMAALQGFSPVGNPEPMHADRVLLTIGGVPTWVQDDGSPIEHVDGQVTPLPTRR